MRALALAGVLLLTACAATPPPTTRYLLPADAPEGTARVDPPVWIGLGRIEVAPYLEQPGLVVETESLQVRPARYHVWAEPLGEGLRRFLGAEISEALGVDVAADVIQGHDWDYTVEIGVDRLHGTLDGDAVLVARWWIRPAAGRGEPVAFRFASAQPLPRAGYAGLVDAEVELARQLAVAIAESLRRETGQGRPAPQG
jgi:uncharacterized lipoprotein YmbA